MFILYNDGYRTDFISDRRVFSGMCTLQLNDQNILTLALSNWIEYEILCPVI